MEGPRNYWQISPGYAGTTALERWPEFRKKKIIAIGWDEVGDLRGYTSKEQLESSLIKEGYAGANRNPKNAVRCCWYFANEMNKGDLIVVKKGSSKSIYGVGRIMGDYYYAETRGNFKHVRKVEWFKAFDIPRNFSGLSRNFAQFTVAKSDTGQFDEIANIVGLSMGAGRDVGNSQEEDEQSNISQLLSSKSQIILYGPPGTGKTYNARRFAVEFVWEG